MIDRLNSIVEANAPPADVEVFTTGVPYIRAEVVQMMIDDETFYLPVTAILFTVIICFLFRAIWVSLAPLVAVNVAILWAMGILFSAGVTFNILSILVPVLSLVIGVADGIHVVSRYREELQHDQDPEQAMGRTMRHMVLPCFLTTLHNQRRIFVATGRQHSGYQGLWSPLCNRHRNSIHRCYVDCTLVARFHSGASNRQTRHSISIRGCIFSQA